MFKKKGFDNEKYIHAQNKEIFKRLNLFDKIYLEIGGHIIYDGHASRVLPGYDPSTKIKLLKTLGNIEIIYCVNSKDIQSKKRLGDFNLTYIEQTLKNIKDFEKENLNIDNIVITRFENEKKSIEFKKRLELKGKKVYITKETKNYSKNINAAIKGYSKNPNIKTKAKIIIVTGAAGGSGKMATAMSQIYLDRKIGIKSGFAKFETFPVWNLPLNHPINLAYEAGTADLGDKNMIDKYHLKAYKIKSTNYNRDIENFKILKKIFNKIAKKNSPLNYKSPTDMGINMVKKGIINENICKKAAIKEIKRRAQRYKKEFKKNRENKKTIIRIEEILKKI